MKTLSLLRHATAVRDPRFVDFDRPLEPSGERDALRLGMRLRDTQAGFDRVICSPAVRTSRTASLLLQAMGLQQPTVELERALYTSSVDRLLRIIAGVDDAVERLLIVGHNPELSELAIFLSADAEELSPCTLVSLHWESTGWLGLELTRPAAVSILRPPY
ncbi:MAG: histidine phosphatase family protein [Betaproteobacteria bacterium]|jgi:phosphohistidine phosphatase|nr:histidine phosphatase family protein [Betaproteobacteria bacterium]